MFTRLIGCQLKVDRGDGTLWGIGIEDVWLFALRQGECGLFQPSFRHPFCPLFCPPGSRTWKSVDTSRISSTSPDGTEIKLNRHFIKSRTKYRWTFAVKTNEAVVGYSHALFRVNDPPAGGSCNFVNKTGRALVDRFYFECQGWRDVDLPLRCEVQLPKEGNASIPVYRGLANSASIILPLGDPDEDYHLNLIIFVVDNLGAAADPLHDVLKVSTLGRFRKHNATPNRDVTCLGTAWARLPVNREVLCFWGPVALCFSSTSPQAAFPGPARPRSMMMYHEAIWRRVVFSKSAYWMSAD